MAAELTLTAVGDIFLGRPEDYPHKSHCRQILRKNPDLYSWFERVAATLQKADFNLGNLEGCICTGGQADKAKLAFGGDIIKMPPEAADALKQTGFTGLAVANNHTMELGETAFLEMLGHLDRVGIARAGGGRDIAEARKPAILEKSGVRVAVLAYTSIFIPGSFPAGQNKPGVATVAVTTSYEVPGNILYAPGVPPRIRTTPNRHDVEQMVEDVRQARSRADIVVVNWHWGLTRYANSVAMGIPVEDAPFFVLNYQEEMGRAAIDAGADLVIGHHPHRLQGLELYKGNLICYSLCRLVFTYNEGPNFGTESLIVKGHIDARSRQLTRVTLIPIKLPPETMEPQPIPPEETADFITMLERLSTKYGTRFQPEGQEIGISAPHPS